MDIIQMMIKRIKMSETFDEGMKIGQDEKMGHRWMKDNSRNYKVNDMNDMTVGEDKQTTLCD